MVKLEDLKQLREVFKSFDLDENGTINCRELGRCMEKLGEDLYCVHQDLYSDNIYYFTSLCVYGSHVV